MVAWNQVDLTFDDEDSCFEIAYVAVVDVVAMTYVMVVVIDQSI